jgi:hypothetical protein
MGAMGDLLDVPRRILPDRVFGCRATVIAILKAATAPIFWRTRAIISFDLGGTPYPSGADRVALPARQAIHHIPAMRRITGGAKQKRL